MPLQRGLWLLRRLRPLSCTLAFSRPVAGSSSGRVPQFRVDVFAQPLAARYTPGVSWENPDGCVSREAPTPSPFWSSVSAAFTCPNSRRFKHGFLSSAWVTGVALFSVSAQRYRYIVSGLHTLPACHVSTHATSPSHRSPDGPVQATRSLVKGRTTQLSG